MILMNDIHIFQMILLVDLLNLTVHLEVYGAVAVLVKDPEQLVQVLLTCCPLAKISGLNKINLNFFSSPFISLYLWHDGGKHDFHLFSVHSSIGAVLHEPLWIMYTVRKVNEGPRIRTDNFWDIFQIVTPSPLPSSAFLDY